MLPISTRSGEWTGITDAFFTATSASCVTGLVVYDTWSHWSWFGQLVILALIQIGGMGVITITTVLSRLVGKRLGLQARATMQEAVSAPNLGEIMKYTRFIFIGCVLFEAIGAIAMSPVFVAEHGLAKGIWLSVFTSISAFCNAGFDLNGSHGQFSSMTPYMDNPVIVITLVFLILTGGLGFLTWMDIRKNGLKFYKYSTQSKIILVMEIVLILIPMLYRHCHDRYPDAHRRCSGFNCRRYEDHYRCNTVLHHDLCFQARESTCGVQTQNYYGSSRRCRCSIYARYHSYALRSNGHFEDREHRLYEDSFRECFSSSNRRTLHGHYSYAL